MTLFSFVALLSLSSVWASPQDNLHMLKQEHPKQYQYRSTLQPLPTRAGHLRFVGSDLAEPQWAPLYLSRYLHENERPQVRRALLDLIHRSLGHIPSEIIERFGEEPESIRANILDMSSFGIIPSAEVQQDVSPLVRAAFIRQVSRDEEASTEFILRAFEDTDSTVLADAARAAHQRGCMEAIPHLARLLSQYDNTVALRALYALSKLDREYARAMVQKYGITESENQHLALFAQSI